MQIDLGQAYTVDKVKVWHYALGGATFNSTKTQVSNDGTNWVTVFDSAVSGTYAETAAGRTTTFTAQSVRYVRDYLNGSNVNANNHWVEIEVWATRTTAYVGNYYEWSGVSSAARTYYYAGAQRVAMREGAGSLTFLLGDHLGSTNKTADASGTLLGEVTYYPFGDTRLAKGAAATTLRYTGQRQESEVGLYYYGARWYDPVIGRFTSADVIVPTAAKPQTFNRYSYVNNNPLRYNDPSGHCPQGDQACWDLAEQLYSKYGWYIDPGQTWSLAQLQIIWSAAVDIQDWFERNGGNGLARMTSAVGTVFFSRDLLSTMTLQNHVYGSSVYLNPIASESNVVHEIGHVLDNRNGTNAIANLFGGAAIWGGGAADDLAEAVGGNIERCQVKFVCSGYNTANEIPFTVYSRSGPSEDFADTFMQSVLNPQGLMAAAPIRAKWMENFAALMVYTPPNVRNSWRPPVWMP